MKPICNGTALPLAQGVTFEISEQCPHEGLARLSPPSGEGSRVG